MSRGWAKASACCLQITLSCASLCHIVSLQYLSRSSLHRLAGLPCRLFLSYGLQVVTREVHRSSLRRLICPAQDHFIFLTVVIISMTFVLSLTQMLVFLSLYVTLSILLSIRPSPSKRAKKTPHRGQPRKEALSPETFDDDITVIRTEPESQRSGHSESRGRRPEAGECTLHYSCHLATTCSLFAARLTDIISLV